MEEEKDELGNALSAAWHIASESVDMMAQLLRALGWVGFLSIKYKSLNTGRFKENTLKSKNIYLILGVHRVMARLFGIRILGLDGYRAMKTAMTHCRGSSTNLPGVYAIRSWYLS